MGKYPQRDGRHGRVYLYSASIRPVVLIRLQQFMLILVGIAALLLPMWWFDLHLACWQDGFVRRHRAEMGELRALLGRMDEDARSRRTS